MAAPPAIEQPALRIAEKIVQLLDRGGFTATYKYAVLIGLMDLCMERTTAKGAPPPMITTRELAEKVIELYWPHCAPYHRPDGAEPTVLAQSTGGAAKPALIVRRIVRFCDDFDTTRTRTPSLHRVRLLAGPEAFRALVDDVEWTLVNMPLPRLQRIGRTQEDRFLYDYSFSETTPRGQVRQYQRDGTGPFKNTLDLGPHVNTTLIALNGVLRPLVYRAWAIMVASMNEIKLSDLEDFLVARPSRISLEPVREDLLRIQDGRCFYCQAGLTTACEVDHFVPWARHADNNVHNLVAAHRSCNGKKSDFLASGEHVDRWSQRSRRRAEELAAVADELRWECDRRRTFGVAAAIYAALPEDAPLWDRGDTFVPLERARVRDALAAGMGA